GRRFESGQPDERQAANDKRRAANEPHAALPSRSPLASTPSSPRTAPVIGCSVSSSGSSAEAEAGTGVPSEPARHSWSTPPDGTLAPRLTASDTEVTPSSTCSSPTSAGHQAEALRLIDGGS